MAVVIIFLIIIAVLDTKPLRTLIFFKHYFLVAQLLWRMYVRSYVTPLQKLFSLHDILIYFRFINCIIISYKKLPKKLKISMF